MQIITLTLLIDNIYEDGNQIRTTEQAEVPPPPLPPLDERGRHEEEAFAEEVEDWEQDHIFPLTGTGKTEGDAAYFVEVTESSHPDLIPVGTKYEFGL